MSSSVELDWQKICSILSNNNFFDGGSTKKIKLQQYFEEHCEDEEGKQLSIVKHDTTMHLVNITNKQLISNILKMIYVKHMVQITMMKNLCFMKSYQIN